MGNIVCARIRLVNGEDRKEFVMRLKKYCHKRLENYKVPVKVEIIGERQYSERFKKVRRLR